MNPFPTKTICCHFVEAADPVYVGFERINHQVAVGMADGAFKGAVSESKSGLATTSLEAQERERERWWTDSCSS